MSYSFLPDARYRMPTHFGPSLGPRQGPEGRRYDCRNTPHQVIVRAEFEASAAELEPFMPPGFSVRRGEIHFTFSYMTEIAWLAGRGYDTFGVSVPTRYAGSADRIDGDLLLVLWENMADPITSGREELGFSKLFCDLPPLRRHEGEIVCEASWDGFRFATLRLAGLGGTLDTAAEASQGLLHYKYIPRTGAPGEADAAYAVLTPAEGGHLRVESQIAARDAFCIFHRATWEELPTLVHIVDALADVSLGRCIRASVTETRGAKDLNDQRILS